MSSNSLLIILTSDKNLLLPTILTCSELIARDEVRSVADICVFLTGLDREAFKVVSDVCEYLGIRAKGIDLEKELLEKTFNKTHVPVSALLRLQTPDLIDDKYKRVLYLDSDIQVLSDLTELMSFVVPPGKILAAPDRFILGGISFGWAKKAWRDDMTYLQSLGVKNPEKYFNSGLVAADRQTWRDSCRDALAFFKENSRICRFHDQSALNAVCQERLIALSRKYNFQTAFRDIGGYDFLEPVVMHFTGEKKPWSVGASFSEANAYEKSLNLFKRNNPDLWGHFCSPKAAPVSECKKDQHSLRSTWYRAYMRQLHRKRFAAYLRRSGASGSSFQA